ncbi:MAG: hypothetical protein J0M35_04145 [Candidatus Obscuribacter phosphatis]|uniref:Uncharacterized protein n=1 Tax=Candidatus Obscuribacter phosphatis TaxID=1906157 RepID=A0A8J7PDA2_9BACT|nr:hypothetical protein [Candidatus Obscuribacter phosphatis]
MSDKKKLSGLAVLLTSIAVLNVVALLLVYFSLLNRGIFDLKPLDNNASSAKGEISVLPNRESAHLVIAKNTDALGNPKLDPEAKIELLRTRADAYLLLEQFAEALNDYSAVLATNIAAASDKANYKQIRKDCTFGAGIAASHQDKFSQAADFFAQGEKEFPEDSAFVFCSIDSLIRLGQRKRAVEKSKSLLAAKPKDSERVRIAEAFFRLSDFKQLDACLGEAKTFENDFDRQKALLLKLRSAICLGEFSRAKQLLENLPNRLAAEPLYQESLLSCLRDSKLSKSIGFEQVRDFIEKVSVADDSNVFLDQDSDQDKFNRLVLARQMLKLTNGCSAKDEHELETLLLRKAGTLKVTGRDWSRLIRLLSAAERERQLQMRLAKTSDDVDDRISYFELLTYCGVSGKSLPTQSALESLEFGPFARKVRVAQLALDLHYPAFAQSIIKRLSAQRPTSSDVARLNLLLVSQALSQGSSAKALNAKAESLEDLDRALSKLKLSDPAVYDCNFYTSGYLSEYSNAQDFETLALALQGRKDRAEEQQSALLKSALLGGAIAEDLFAR